MVENRPEPQEVAGTGASPASRLVMFFQSWTQGSGSLDIALSSRVFLSSRTLTGSAYRNLTKPIETSQSPVLQGKIGIMGIYNHCR